jgi:hypothetical protein
LSSSTTKNDSVREQNQDNRLNERRMLCDHSISDGMWKLELWSFLDGNDQQQGEAGSDRYEGSERSSLMKNALWN